MDKVTRQCPQTTAFEEKGKPKRYRTEVFPFTAYRLTARPNRLSYGGGGEGDYIPIATLSPPERFLH